MRLRAEPHLFLYLQSRHSQIQGREVLNSLNKQANVMAYTWFRGSAGTIGYYSRRDLRFWVVDKKKKV